MARIASNDPSSGATNARQASPSPARIRSRLAAVASTSRYSAIARPPSSGWAAHAPGWVQRSPWRSSGMRANTGEAAPEGWTAENVSWRKPGSVSSSVRTAPPGRSAASSTVTAWPASASRMAAARPLGPAPMTTARSLTPVTVARPGPSAVWHRALTIVPEPD